MSPFNGPIKGKATDAQQPYLTQVGSSHEKGREQLTRIISKSRPWGVFSTSGGEQEWGGLRGGSLVIDPFERRQQSFYTDLWQWERVSPRRHFIAQWLQPPSCVSLFLPLNPPELSTHSLALWRRLRQGGKRRGVDDVGWSQVRIRVTMTIPQIGYPWQRAGENEWGIEWRSREEEGKMGGVMGKLVSCRRVNINSNWSDLWFSL